MQGYRGKFCSVVENNGHYYSCQISTGVAHSVYVPLQCERGHGEQGRIGCLLSDLGAHFRAGCIHQPYIHQHVARLRRVEADMLEGFTPRRFHRSYVRT